MKALSDKKPTINSLGLRLGNFVQIRNIIDEELEAVWAGKKTAKQALDAAVERGNAELARFAKANKKVNADPQHRGRGPAGLPPFPPGRLSAAFPPQGTPPTRTRSRYAGWTLRVQGQETPASSPLSSCCPSSPSRWCISSTPPVKRSWVVLHGRLFRSFQRIRRIGQLHHAVFRSELSGNAALDARVQPRHHRPSRWGPPCCSRSTPIR